MHHAAIHLQRFQLYARIFIHRIQYFARLVSRRFESRSRDVALVHVTSHADDDSARVVFPIRRIQTAEGRHKVNAAVVGDTICQRFHIR